MARYILINKSLSGHGCCFGYTIVDTRAKVPEELAASLVDETERVGKLVCECTDQEEAERVLTALNQTETGDH